MILDHHSLLKFHNLKGPQGTLGRWALRLQPYDIELIHRKGKDHIVLDFLSRPVPPSSENIVAVNEIPSYHQTSDK